MRISPITNSKTNFIKCRQNLNFGMSLHVPKNTKNLIDKHMRARVIDPIEWLATARALEKTDAHYEIISKSNKSKWAELLGNDTFIITRHADDAEVRALESNPENLLATIQTLDSEVSSAIQIQKQQIDGNIISATNLICKQKPEISLIETKSKPVSTLENKKQNIDL